MLVLTRKTRQSILIGNTRVVILSARRGGVRLGIDAPREVDVIREECGARIGSADPGSSSDETEHPKAAHSRPGPRRRAARRCRLSQTPKPAHTKTAAVVEQFAPLQRVRRPPECGQLNV